MDRVWSEIIDGADLSERYRPPTAVVSYQPGTLPETDCSFRRSAETFRNNASFCGLDGRITYDAAFLFDLYRSTSAFAPVAVLAHEWGHHIQALLGLDLESIRRELQADCFAGLYVGISESLSGSWAPSIDDSVLAAANFYIAGDLEYGSVPWFDRDVHGSPWQRFMAYVTGYRTTVPPDIMGGSPAAASPAPGFVGDTALPFCLGYAEFEPNDYSWLGPFRLLNLPGLDVTTTPDGSLVVTQPPQRGNELPTVTITWHEVVGGGVEVLPAVDVEAWLSAAAARFGPSVRALEGTTLDLSAMVGGTSTAPAFYLLGSGAQGRHGFLVPVVTQEGLLVVTVDEPGVITDPAAPTSEESSQVAVEFATLIQVLNRLCGPGESGEAGVGFDPACGDTN